MTGPRCQQCLTPIAPGETIWRHENAGTCHAQCLPGGDPNGREAGQSFYWYWTERACQHCERRFMDGGWYRRRYCSDDCYADASRARARESRKTVAARRPPAACARCGQPFTPARADAAYCSGKCRTAAYRQRRTEGNT